MTNLTIAQYRAAVVTAVPCPFCLASICGRCCFVRRDRDGHLVPVPSSLVDYIHDERSLAYELPYVAELRALHAELARWEAAVEPDGGASLITVRGAAKLMRAALANQAVG